MSMEVPISNIPFKPVTRQEIGRLEAALLVGTLLRQDVLEKIKGAEDRLTWVDSLAVAAAALAREKVGLPTSQIAEEAGRTEASIRGHLSGKTEAGKLVKEAYEQLLKEGRIKIPIAGPLEELEKERKARLELERKLQRATEALEALLKELKA